MKTYIYKVTPSSAARGYNRTIEVYRIKHNQPIYLGCNEHINTASYKGDIATAKQLIAKLEGYKFRGYDFKHCANINVWEV
jgi:hypothetical protein